MEEQTQYIDSLISDYLSGELSPEGLVNLKAWALQSEQQKAYVRSRIGIAFSAEVAESSARFDTDKAYKRFHTRTSSKKAPKEERLFHIGWKYLGYAAAVILLLALPLAGYWSGQQSVTQTFSDIVVEAPMGAQTKMSLPDGTQVWLNAGSKMSYSQGFGVNDRKVKLEGEGYFEVTHNAEKPFVVNTSEMDVRVLGTKFSFRNYSDDQEAVVSLNEGKVALKNRLRDMPEQLLAPNERMILNKRTGDMTLQRVKAENTAVWLNNELFFDEELLTDIAKKLSRSYNVRIEVADSLCSRRFYGSFKITGNTLDEVLQTMASTNKMKFRKNKNGYILY